MGVLPMAKRAKKVNVVESVKRYLAGGEKKLARSVTLIVLRELLNAPKTTRELQLKAVNELNQPVNYSLLRTILNNLEKKRVVKSEKLLFSKSLLWSLNLDKKELAELQKLLEKTSSPRSS
jgi:hypothetical protein